MSDRSFFTYRGWQSAEHGFVSQAMSQLMKHHVARFSLEETQRFAWDEELRILDSVASRHPYCTIALEYMIPRMGKRVDAIILIDKHIFVVEFKVGEETYPSEAQDQVADYTFDLKNFHGDSHNRSLFPILVCTDALARSNDRFMSEDGIYQIQFTNAQTLADVIDSCLAIPLPNNPVLNHEKWLAAPYQPTPTIIEAAQALYQHNTVEDISRSEAGTTNIAATTNCINKIIDHSRKVGRKSICFITGVPGAGKTLVGLNLASTRRAKDGEINDETAVFLSGNGPLITVLQASLVEDQQARYQDECRACKSSDQPYDCKGCPCKKTKKQIEAEVKTFVQGVHLFREELFLSYDPPAEHIAIFDEAQRAWSEDWLAYKMRTRRQNKRAGVAKSEPECLIEYMNRHRDWACMICLVGGGQEINQGEAGIIEWFKSLRGHFSDWDVYAPDSIQGENYLNDVDLFDICPNINIVNDLHLSVDMRSFRNKNVAAFAEALVSNRPNEAKELYKQIEGDYPIYVTRSLAVAKEWVRTSTKRPSDRFGIVADSYGQRMRADGIIVPTMDFDAVKWFLRGKDEVDSSYFMEIAASEFKIQGLEIDYAIVAWEGDYRYTNGNFEYHQFYGGKWQNVNAEMKRRYLKNGYRVLLTRARQGFVIYVPEGSDIDPTRPASYYDETYEYLLAAGIRELETTNN